MLETKKVFMPRHDYENSPLEKWIRERNMTTNDFVKLVRCSRPVVWKAKKGLPICSYYSRRIFKITGIDVWIERDKKKF
jgi:hypothetical protein